MTDRRINVAAAGDEIAASEMGLLPHLVSIAKSVRQLIGIKLAECGVAPGQDQFLLCFLDHTPRSVAEIAACLSVRPSTVSKMTDVLEGNGWISRRADTHDARKVLVYLTDAGRKTRDDVRAVWQSLEADLAPALSSQPQTLEALAEIDILLERRLRRLR